MQWTSNPQNDLLCVDRFYVYWSVQYRLIKAESAVSLFEAIVCRSFPIRLHKASLIFVLALILAGMRIDTKDLKNIFRKVKTLDLRWYSNLE